jgi:hypothetical protein
MATAVGSTIRSQSCASCANSFPEDHEVCPHCSQPSLYPNVTVTQHPDELSELDSRFSNALKSADTRGCRKVVDEFLNAASASNAVVCCTAAKLVPLATAHQNLYANFYDLEHLYFSREYGVGEIDWNVGRPVAETRLFGSKKILGKLHYAALSIEDTGVPNYGEYSIVPRESMIRHRTSVFEENSGVYCDTHIGPIPLGLRSNWQDRGKICVAKLAGQLNSATNSSTFPSIFVEKSATSSGDKFVEAQIFGPMTAYTFEKITYTGTKPATKRGRVTSKAHQLAIRDMCAKTGVTFK